MEVRLAVEKPGDITSGTNSRMGEGEQTTPGWDSPLYKYLGLIVMVINVLCGLSYAQAAGPSTNDVRKMTKKSACS